MNRVSIRWVALGVMGAVFSCPGCGSEGDTASNAGSAGQGGAAGIGGTGGAGGAAAGGTAAGGTAGSTQGGTGGTASQTEVCDGLDNNGDGVVDEGCPCTVGDVQDCYPMPAAPPLGCKTGTQTCIDSGWGPCTGVRMPAPGEDSCCTEIGDNPYFEVYDAFVAANPAASMPESIDALTAFMPTAGEYKMKWSEYVPGDEFVDHKIGGLSEANINAGRAFARERAEEAVPDDATIVATTEEPVSVKVLSGEAPCNGVGWGWGSLLYQRPDFSVGEMAYLYVGYCAELPTKDGEAFFYSEEPVVVCQAPIVK